MYEGVAPPTPDAGQVELYAKTDGKLYSKNDIGVESEVLGQKDRESKSITIENPSASEDISFFYTDVAITIQEMKAVLSGTTPSLTWTVRHSTDRSATGNEVVTGGTTTTSTTTGDTITSFDDPSIPANSFVWIETTGVSGSVISAHLSVTFDED